ncbi:MAG: hypothetical protein ACE5G8_03875, partial [Anaerolineae bacterium]
WRYMPLPLLEALQFEVSSPSNNLLIPCSIHVIELLKTVCTHLPAYLVEQVAQDPVPGRAAGQFVNGTLLFADTSGFTAMS